MADDFDIIVIGSGPGGYVCAIRAAQLGLRVACIDKRGTHGGTCLNVGCIPSKALLHASETYSQAAHANHMGIQFGTPKIDMPALMKYKQKTIDGNVQGIDFLFKKNKIEAMHGAGELIAPDRVKVALLDGGERILQTKYIVIATGSDIAPLAGVEIDEQRIVSSTGALDFDSVPKSLLIVGGGVIGLELGSVWARLGTEVTVVEFLDHIIAGADADIAKQFQTVLTKQGLRFLLGRKVTNIETLKASAKVTIAPAQNQNEAGQNEAGQKGANEAGETLSAERVLVAIGRRPYTAGLGLENVGVQLDAQGRVETDKHFKTNIDNIYAIGDVIAGPMLAHKAEDEGIAVAEILVGQAGHVNYDVIPNVIYTAPEVAWVGKTEAELKSANIAYKVGTFPFMANGRAKVNGTVEGFVKTLADANTDRILGVHILGPEAGNMIGEAAVAMEFGASADDIARTCHAHPTLSEALKESALAVAARAIHM
ncbi:MAG: dihydrolipoyl dehydrogenase [Alphaproteobacteria bacterium]|nr:dihydrolipoyl dehydrogenase [Alphaproteobacteria bacterium]